jgi:hypothetical protein
VRRSFVVRTEPLAEELVDVPSSIWSGLLLTVIAWFVTRIVVGATWGPARNPFSFRTSLWNHWDSLNYIAIAFHGRSLGRCGGPGFPVNAIARQVNAKWCGTAAWLPGYPWLMRAMHWVGISAPDAGVLIAWLATAVALFLIWFGWGRTLPLGRALILLLIFGLFPGAVYNFAIFPMSVTLVFVVGAILAASRDRFFVAALLMTLAGLCYPSAWFAATGLAIALILVALPLGALVIIRRALWGIAGLSSLLVLAVVDQLVLGHADAYFLGESASSFFSYGRSLIDVVIMQNTLPQKRMGGDASAALSFQALIAVGLSVSAALIAGRAWLRARQTTVEAYPALVGLAVIVGLNFSNSAGTWSRSVVLASPCVVCLRRLNFPMLCLVTGLVGTMTAVVSHSFFNNILI